MDARIMKEEGWTLVSIEKPAVETPVLACVHGLNHPIVLELRWEVCNPMIEGYFEDFLFWDAPDNDGQDFGDRVFAWQSLPAMPTLPPNELRMPEL